MAPKPTPKYVMCVANEGNEISLVLGKVYRVVKPQKLDPPSMIRVIDESGEDCLFGKSWFVPVHFPIRTKNAVDGALTAGLP